MTIEARDANRVPTKDRYLEPDGTMVLEVDPDTFETIQNVRHKMLMEVRSAREEAAAERRFVAWFSQRFRVTFGKVRLVVNARVNWYHGNPTPPPEGRWYP